MRAVSMLAFCSGYTRSLMKSIKIIKKIKLRAIINFDKKQTKQVRRRNELHEQLKPAAVQQQVTIAMGKNGKSKWKYIKTVNRKSKLIYYNLWSVEPKIIAMRYAPRRQLIRVERVICLLTPRIDYVYTHTRTHTEKC